MNQRAHAPYLYEHPGCQMMIVFIHGILGSPDQFKPMMRAAIQKGYSVSSMLLPGHGGTGRDFARTNRARWTDAVRAHLDDICGRYQNVILVGHSMGALLALLAYDGYRDSIKGIVAIATPLRIAVKPRAVFVSCRVVFGKVREDDMRGRAALESCSVERSSLFSYLSGAPRYIDLFRLMRAAARALDGVDAPTLIIHAKGDEVADIRGAGILERGLKRFQTVTLAESGHYFYSPRDLEIVIDAFIRFLRAHCAQL